MTSHKFSVASKSVPFVKTLHRVIQTDIPAPGTDVLLAKLSSCESRSMQGQMPIIWDSAKDYSIYDKAGNKWIDFTSTIFVANVGHSNDAVIAAIKSTLDKSLLTTYAYANDIRVSYQQNLINFAGPNFDKAFLLSSGTEATEASMKLMRMYGLASGKKKLGIICIKGNWHGRTMGAQMMSSNDLQKKWIGYQDTNVHYIDFPYPWVVEDSVAGDFLLSSLNQLEAQGVNLATDICGFMLETFQGWGAVFYPKKYVKKIEEICRKYKILLTFDEMQAGFGRTGKKFGYENYDVQPDLICCGKGMGGGVPLSGVLGRAEIMDLPEIGNMSSTHSANPIACSAGLAVLNEIEARQLVQESHRKGLILHSKLTEIQLEFPQLIDRVLGKGMIAALILKDKDGGANARAASAIAEECMRNGLLVVHTGRESIKIGPPLVIDDDALLEGIEVLKQAIKKVQG
jgi:4-aminobutyrate aminotransferase/(S)-3-amino-2-methylpropionate transaminase